MIPAIAPSVPDFLFHPLLMATKRERSAAEALRFASPALRGRVEKRVTPDAVELTWKRGARTLTLRATEHALGFVQEESDRRTEGEVVHDRHLYALLEWIERG